MYCTLSLLNFYTMRAIIQRVAQASVSVGDELVSSIGRGICVLVGISRDDTVKDMEYIVRKILNLRVFEDDQGKRWNKSVMDKNYEILCVSQFTLYSVLKGNKPDFHCSMGGEQSQQFYEQFLDQLRKSYKPDFIKDGRFGAYMQVNIQNDGPVTIEIESPADAAPTSKKETKGAGKKATGQSQLKETDGSSAATMNSLADELESKASTS